MGKGTLNPAEIQRKKEKKRFIEKNKLKLDKLHDISVINKNPENILSEIEKLKAKIGENNKNEKAQLRLKNLHNIYNDVTKKNIERKRMLDAENASVKGLSRIIGKSKDQKIKITNNNDEAEESSESENESDNEYNSDDSIEPPNSDDSFSPPSSPKIAPPPGLEVPQYLEPVELVPYAPGPSLPMPSNKFNATPHGMGLPKNRSFNDRTPNSGGRPFLPQLPTKKADPFSIDPEADIRNASQSVNIPSRKIAAHAFIPTTVLLKRPNPQPQPIVKSVPKLEETSNVSQAYADFMNEIEGL